ncbi:MAG TPA: ABATE domain-containing protein [Gaiellaceae bacterium]|nr:ABATE domain-containing protein [Gaiellaceae bacterium]
MVLPHERDSIALAVALANTWDVLNDPPEHLDDIEMLQVILRAFRLDDEAMRAREGDLAPLRAMRDRLRKAFGAADEAKAVEELNAVAREAGAIPQLEPRNGGWTFRYGIGRRSLVDELAGRASVALLGVIEEGGWKRFGLCAASPCCCVFVDRSRNRSRRYCCHYCADRATQAAARRRRRARTA